MRTKILYIAFSTFLFLGTLEAQLKKLNGFLEYDHISYFENIDNKINGRNQGILFLEYESDILSKHKFYSSVEFRNDQSDASRNRLYMDELYFDLHHKKLDVRIGKQIISWGKADGYNPVNLINPIDYSDILDTEDETLGTYSLNGKLFFKDWYLQSIFVPVFNPNILPLDPGNRWNVNQAELIQEATNLNYVNPIYENPDLPYNDIRSFQLAFSIAGSVRGIDVSTYYYKGYNHIPEVLTQIIPFTADSVMARIQSHYFEQQMWGGAFSTGIGYMGIRGEAAYIRPEGKQDSVPYFQYVVGIDRTISNLIGNNDVFLIVQWIHELSEGSYEYSNLNLNHLFQKTLSGRAEIDLGNYLQLNLQGIYNLDYDEIYARIGIDWSIADGLNLKISSDLIKGTQGNFFNLYRQNQRLQVRLKYNF